MNPREGRPAEDGTARGSLDGSPGSVPVQLRRRRDAALRLPPLPCGRRDPLTLLDEGPRRFTDAEVTSWRAAEAYLRWCGLEPAAPRWVLAELARAGRVAA